MFLVGIAYSSLLYAAPEIEISGLNSELEDNVRAVVCAYGM